LATARLILAKLALNAGNLDDAEEHARELAAILPEHPYVESPELGDPAYLLTIIHAVRGEHEEALRQAHISLASWEPAHGFDSEIVQQLHSIVAAMLLALGRVD